MGVKHSLDINIFVGKWYVLSSCDNNYNKQEIVYFYKDGTLHRSSKKTDIHGVFTYDKDILHRNKHNMFYNSNSDHLNIEWMYNDHAIIHENGIYMILCRQDTIRKCCLYKLFIMASRMGCNLDDMIFYNDIIY